MNDTLFTYGVFLAIAIAVGIWMSKRGENSRTVITGPSKTEVEEQRERFLAMTIAELRTYIASKGRTGRLPSRKAEIVEVALELWRAQPW